jgi:hypothetical protein
MGAVNPDDLLLQVLLSPGDEALRAVYVDQLLERGDVRGEHARLLRQGRAAEAAALAKVHGLSWLPASVAPFVVEGSARFRDGLLEGCALRAMNAAEAQRAAAEPLWSAVRELDGAPGEIVTQATALETLRGVSGELLAELGGWKTRLPTVKHLALRVRDVGAAQGALGTLDLPNLVSLAVLVVGEGRNGRHFEVDELGLQCCEECGRGEDPRASPAFEPAAWRDFFSSPLGVRLEALTLHVGWVALSAWLPALERSRLDVARLRLCAAEEDDGSLPGWCVALRRTSPGRYAEATVEVDAASPAETFDLRWLLRTAPEGVELDRRGRRLAAT